MGKVRLWFSSHPPAQWLEARIVQIYSGETTGAERVTSSPFARVLRFQGDDGHVYYFKEFFSRHLRDRLQVIIRPSRAWRDRAGAALLRQHGFCAPDPVCLGEQRWLGMVTRNFLVSAAVSDAVPANVFFQQQWTGTQPSQRLVMKRHFLTVLGQAIGRLHSCGIFHGDLRIRNILVTAGEPPEICLLDNERTRKYRNLPRRVRLKNLVQVNMVVLSELTTRDRMRFFRAYLEENPDLIADRKKWATAVAVTTRSRFQKKGWAFP